MANGRHWGVRSIVSLIIFILAAVSTPVALVGNWGHRTVVDSQVYLETVGPLASDPAIQEALTDRLTSAFEAQVDTTSLVGSFLGNFIDNPELTDKLAGPISAGINSLVRNLIARFVASEEFQKLWIDVNTVAQKSLVALLEGKNEGPIQIRDSAIVLDISSLLNVVQQKLVDQGISIAANVTIPDDDKQIVLYENSAIGAIQTIYRFTGPMLTFYPLIIAILFAISIALARNRPRTVLATGIALAASSLLLTFTMNSIRDVVTSQYAGNVLAAAFDSFWEQFFGNLLTGITALLILGIFIGLAGWYAGRSRPATRIREEVCVGLHEIGAGAPRGLNTWIRSYAAVLRWAVGIVLILILVLGDVLLPWRVVWLSALAAGLFTLIEMFNAPDREVVVDEVIVVEVT